MLNFNNNAIIFDKYVTLIEILAVDLQCKIKKHNYKTSKNLFTNMKKLTSLLVLMVITISLSAQRISSLTIDGIPSCVPFAAFNPTNNSETVLGDGQIIYPDGTDLSNVNIALNVGTDAFVESPNPLPTDWSSTVTGIKVTKTDLSAWAKYNIILKKIKPASLPLEIKTGSGNFSSDSWTTSTVGWAGACIDKSQTLIRLGSAKRSFMVAFNSTPDSLIYTIKYLSTPWSTSNVFDVDGSADGINWTSIVQYNATNAMPLTSPAVITKVKISSQYRFVRWIYTTRVATANVSIENILVTKDTSTSVLSPREQGVRLYNAGGNNLRLENQNEVESLRIYNLSGTLVLEQKNPVSLISAQNLVSGIYLADIRLKSGNVITNKFVR